VAHGIRKPIPNNLRKHRRLAGFSQEEVRKHLRLTSASVVSRWENGITMPNGEYLLQLSILYKTLVNELYYELGKEYQQVLFPEEYPDAHGQHGNKRKPLDRGP